MVSENLSVCLSVVKFDLNYLRTGGIEWAEIFFRISLSNPKFLIFLGRGPVWPGQRAKKLTICPSMPVFAQKAIFNTKIAT